MKRYLFLFGIALVGGLLIRAFVAEAIFIASPSMEPTLKTGRHMVSEKLTFKFRDPRHGDIIVFPSPVDDGKDLVKRVIATGGDTLEIRRKKVYLNGTLLPEPYTQFTRADEMLRGDNLGPLDVPPRSLFVMGDNRDESGDSRDWKTPSGDRRYFIKVSEVKGRLLNFP